MIPATLDHVRMPYIPEPVWRALDDGTVTFDHVPMPSTSGRVRHALNGGAA